VYVTYKLNASLSKHIQVGLEEFIRPSVLHSLFLSEFWSWLAVIKSYSNFMLLFSPHLTTCVPFRSLV